MSKKLNKNIKIKQLKKIIIHFVELNQYYLDYKFSNIENLHNDPLK